VVCPDWMDAYDCCRERDRPTVCQVGDSVGRCFPSGRFEALNEAARFEVALDSKHTPSDGAGE